MNLLQDIRNDRARQRSKRAYGRNLFNTVSCVVKGYGLGDAFLKRLNETEDHHSRKRIECSEIKAKKALELSLFPLASKEEYRIVMIIAGKLDNPYLQFAHTPEELLLSAPLYRANPALGPEDLLRHDFETLLLCQRAREELAGLEERLTRINVIGSQVGVLDAYRGDGAHPSRLSERIKQLQTFIAHVENMEQQPG